MEKWKDVKNYEGIYQVSNLGNIKTIRKNKIMKLNKRNGYYQICLRKNENRESKQVHRLVAEAFIDNPLNKKVVNHKDFNPLNNNVNNLEWCTQKENINWSICNMKHQHNTKLPKYTNEKYIRFKNNKYEINIDKKYYGRYKTLKEAIMIRNKVIDEKV